MILRSAPHLWHRTSQMLHGAGIFTHKTGQFLVRIHIPAPWFASGLWSCQASLNHSYLRIINHSYWSYKPTEHYRTLVLPSISLTGHPPHSSQLDSQVVVYHPDRRFLFAMAVCVYNVGVHQKKQGRKYIMPILYYIMIQENIGSDHQKKWD